MPSTRPTLESGGIVLGDPLVRAAVAAILVAVLLGGRLWLDNRALRSRLDASQAEVAAAESRERELARAVAEKHRQLESADTELEATRWRMDAVELQLDGVDRLSRVVREELRLPAGSGTWGQEAVLEPPQGGPGQALDVADRVELARRRLSYGLQELDQLLTFAKERTAPAPQAQPPTGSAVAAELPDAWPLKGDATSAFGWRLFRGRPDYHTGIDLAAPYGATVHATAPGTVVGSGWQPGYGWSVLVQHSGGYHTLYAHLSALEVRNGTEVAEGAIVGLTGSSGRSTGPHLHYEIWKDGVLLDPWTYLAGSAPR